MSQRQTRANPNPQVEAATPPAVAPTSVVNPIVAPVALTKDFGRDKKSKDSPQEPPTQGFHWRRS